ncbi:MAG: hypothetical protein AAFY76_00955 [Cyanobacteria bacterium J06649_11]
MQESFEHLVEVAAGDLDVEGDLFVSVVGGFFGGFWSIVDF